MSRSPRPSSRRALRLGAALVAALMLFGAVPITSANHLSGGFDTSRGAMLDPLAGLPPGFTVDPIITVGDTLPGGYRFESIPDGISILPSGSGGDDDDDDDDDDRGGGKRGQATVFVNHETSTVPFPFPADGVAATESNSQNDFDNSQVSRLVLNRQAAVVSGELAIRSVEGFHRFCSNYLPTKKEGFDRPILFTNEEGVDWVNKTGKQWPAPIGGATSRQIGVVVAHDVRNGQTRQIWGMGRLNHENTVAIPGYRDVVMLTTDDTFTTTPSQSQLYSYIADDDRDVWRDRGDLWAFRSTTPGITRYDDFNPLTGTPTSVTGEFINVPRLIATGRHASGVDIKSSDPQVIALLDAADGAAGNGNYPPPSDGSWQRRPGAPATEAGMDGPQWVLEKWSQISNVFDFVRLEDLAYDKRRNMQNVVYIVDSGRGTAGVPQAGRSTNGRVWKMVLDKKDPKKVTSLSILIEGDDNEVKTSGEMHQPDNMESTKNGLYFTEDPGSSQQFNFTPEQLADPRRTEARIFQYLFNAPAGQQNPRPIFKVNQSQDEEVGYDVDSAAKGNLGAWESSGIVDASAVYGPGAFLVTIQASTLWIEKGPGPDTIAPFDNPDWTNKRSGGQFLLIRVPGG